MKANRLATHWPPGESNFFSEELNQRIGELHSVAKLFVGVLPHPPPNEIDYAIQAHFDPCFFRLLIGWLGDYGHLGQSASVAARENRIALQLSRNFIGPCLVPYT